jgi:hypothetical protein
MVINRRVAHANGNAHNATLRNRRLASRGDFSFQVMPSRLWSTLNASGSSFLLILLTIEYAAAP